MAKRILVRNLGPSMDNVIRALAVTIKCAQTADVSLIHLIIPSKSLLSGSVISNVLGDSATSQLLSGETVPLPENISMKLESVGTLRDSTAIKVALAAYLDGRDMRKVDSLSNLNSVVFLPWISEVGEGWQQSYGAEIDGEQVSATNLNLSPDVEKELNSLTGRINLSTGLSHPSDLQAAKQMFRKFNKASIPYDPTTIRSWALRNGWRPDFAEKLYDLAQRYHQT